MFIIIFLVYLNCVLLILRPFKVKFNIIIIYWAIIYLLFVSILHYPVPSTQSDLENYTNYFRNKFLPVRLAKDLTILQLSRLEEKKHDLSGIIYKQFPERIFNDEIRAAHVLGYLKEFNSEMLISTNNL